MIKKVLPPLVALAAIAQVSFVGGLSSDATGGPASGGQYCGNASCHGGNPGDFDPLLKVRLLSGADTISEYVPGETYRLRVEINAREGAPGGYGFQATALQADTIAGAGVFSEPGEDVRTFVLSGRPYATHSTRSATNFFEVDWTAPEAGFGDVEFWVAGNAVNADGSNGGDNPVRTMSPVVFPESELTRVREIRHVTSWTISPNPVSGQPVQCRVFAQQGDRVDLRVLASDGRVVQESRWQLQAGENNRLISLETLPAGSYIVQLLSREGRLSRKMIKR